MLLVVVEPRLDGLSFSENIHICDDDLSRSSDISLNSNENNVSINIDSQTFGKFIKLLQCSLTFQRHFYHRSLEATNQGYQSLHEKPPLHLVVNLITPEKDFLDHVWGRKIQLLVNEYCEIENAMAWLSTLGGAYSCLGENAVRFAEEAERISYIQLKLSKKLGDPIAISRCHIYVAISLLQRDHLKLARRIIRNEFKFAQTIKAIDSRLSKMCLGVWSKLQYLHQLEKEKKCRNKITYPTS